MFHGHGYAATPKVQVHRLRRRSPKLHACSLPRGGSAALSAGCIACEGLHGKGEGCRGDSNRASWHACQ